MEAFIEPISVELHYISFSYAATEMPKSKQEILNTIFLSNSRLFFLAFNCHIQCQVYQKLGIIMKNDAHTTSSDAFCQFSRHNNFLTL